MPVKGGGGIGGPRKKPKPKSSVGAAIKQAGSRPAPKRPTPKPGARTVGKAVQQAGRPLPKRTAPPATRDAPQTRKQDSKRAAQAKRRQRARAQQSRVIGKAVKQTAAREQERQDQKALQRAVIQAAPTPEYGLDRVQSGLSKVLLGAKPSQRLTSRERETLDSLTRKGKLSPRVAREVKEARRSGVSKANAAALEVLDQTLRPTRAIAGTADALLKGKNVVEAQRRGLVKNKGPLFGDVLRDAGAPGVVAGVGGFALDVATDPTTYVTFGTGSVAKKAATTAATATAQKAAKAGMSKAGQETVARQAAKKAAAAAKPGSGLTVKFAGKEVPGVRKGTATVGRATRARKPQGKVRSAGRQVNPRIAPKGVDNAEFQTMKQSERRARATRSEARRRASDRGRVLADKLEPKDYAKVVDAIERGQIKKLPEHLRPIARRVRDDFKYELRLRRRAGVSTGDVTRHRTQLVRPLRPTKRGRLTAESVKDGLPRVTADVEGKRAVAAEAAKRRAAVEAAARGTRSRRLPSRDEFIAQRPRPSHDSPEPTVDDLAATVKPRQGSGVRVESEHRIKVDPRTKQTVGHGDPLPGSKVVVARENGEVVGVLRAFFNGDGKADLLEVAVKPEHRGKGIASKLYERAEAKGWDVESASGAGGLTEAGAALKHKRMTKALARERKRVERELRSARGAVRSADEQFARELRLQQAEQRRLRAAVKRRKERAGEAKGYAPHVPDDSLPGKKRPAAAQRTVRPASSKRRMDRRPVLAQNAEREAAGAAPFSTNLPNLYADYVARSGNARAQAQVARDLAEQGRRVGKSQNGIKLADDESVYHVGGATGTSKETTRGIRKIERDSDEYDRLLTKGTTKEGGRYVVLKDDLVEEAYRNLGTDRTAIGAGFDKAMGGWKTIATGTPGFHIRNMIGDTQMAYLGQRGRRMPANVRASARALKEQTRRDVAAKTTVSGQAKGTGKTVKLGGKTVPVSEFVDELMEQGVLRSGQRGRELEDLLSGTGDVRTRNLTTKRARARAKASKAWGPVERLMQNREDWMRAATYKEARDRGMSPAEAADWSMKHHIDYGDLTEAERVFGRRAAPFYTFTARAIPLHAQRLVTNPGKFATVEKARQETAGAFGMGEDWEKDLPEYKQRAIPLGVKIGGNKMALDAELPINTLNELPGFKKPGEQIGEWGQFIAGLVTPAGKIPAELLANRSFFFRRDIESDDRPLVSAPSWVKALPKGVQDTLGVTKIKDRRSGKMVLGWPGRTDYIVRQVPGMPALMNSLTTEGAGRSGRAGWEKWVSATGVKFDPVDGNTTRIFKLFEEQRKLEKQRNALGQQNREGGTRSTDPEVRDLSKRIRELDEQIYELSVKRGDAEPYRENAIGKGKAAQIRNKATGNQAAPLSGLSPGQQRMLEQRTTGSTGMTPGQQKMLEARMQGVK